MTSKYLQGKESSEKKRPTFFSRYPIILIGIFSILLYVGAALIYLRNDEVISVGTSGRFSHFWLAGGLCGAK
jgi:hypothetical protein